MSQKDKLIERLLTRPKDFTYNEAKTLLGHFGYNEALGGKTGGSKISFTKDKDYIKMHKPHPIKILKTYQVNNLINNLRGRGLL